MKSILVQENNLDHPISVFTYLITSFADLETNSFVVVMIWSRKALRRVRPETWTELWISTKICWSRSIHSIRQGLLCQFFKRNYLDLKSHLQQVQLEFLSPIELMIFIAKFHHLMLQ
jgi:hypothetical protein